MLRMKAEVTAALDTPAGLQAALQQAIQLEHATIPPYLYALYSLQAGGNDEIAALVASVVSEEMAHMALACNLLNAIGGSPVIDQVGFIPTYPGSLPGTVEDQLTVPLAPFSIDLVRDVFMVIEQPAEPIPIPTLDESVQPLTIGEFYERIGAQIAAAGESIFDAGHEGFQVFGGIALPEVIPVTDLASAATAIATIVEQGEGSSTSPFDDATDSELAHYYKFSEIVQGRQLVAAPGEDPPWRYAGDPIPFDATKVHPVVTNPSLAPYPAKSAAKYGNETFNYTYTSLLKVLHATFNGDPGRLDAAVGLMESLSEQAQTLMTIGLPGAGATAGPSFEYQPTNPPVATG